MNILLMDPYVGKFTRDMENWWENQGHQVHRSTYYDPSWVDWANVIWFDTTDNNILSATNPSQALLDDEANYQPWDIHHHDLTGKKVIVRMIDIEVWQQHYMAAKWDVVTDIIFIAPHIRNLVEIEGLDGYHPNLKVHTISCGVDLNRFKFAERGPGFDVAIVSEKWSSKGTHENLQVILALNRLDPRYKFHWLGQRSDSNWEYAYFDEFVEHHKLPIEFTNILLDDQTVDEFLEGKNYLLHGSIKEAYGYAIAEAMAKGIKVIPHRFYGADDIWPGLTWDTIDEALDMFKEEYDSDYYRQYLIDHGYDLQSMMKAFDKIIGG